MKTLREEFEELSEVAATISHHIYFGDDNLYHSDLINFEKLVCWLNGAWYAYQEQHKKIVAYQKMIEMEKCLNKANKLMSGAFHHGENIIHVGKVDNPNQTLTINVDENGNIETSNHNGDDK